MIYLAVRHDVPTEVISRSSVAFDVEAAKSCMLRLEAEYAWTASGEGFDLLLGQGPTREIIRIEGVRFVEYRDHYLNLALDVVPVLGLALTNARNFQLLRDEEAKLRAAVQARDMILAFVSHDLRNPLASIALNAASLERLFSAPADERFVGRTRAIQRSIARMSRLIEDLLDMSKMEAGVFSVQAIECSAEDVLSEALRELRPQAEMRGTRLDEKRCGDLRLRCDRDRIVQVLVNLVGNAIHFVPEHEGVITIDCHEERGEALFSVSDNGPGIRAEELPHVFDVYWQGREKKRTGAGLGLAIARGIVETHGGRIWVESVLGKGAAFFFTIPSARPGG